MSFKDILLQVRSMRRSAQIRNESDPKKVAAILEDLLRESIHLQNAGDKGFQKKSMAELRQIRQDLVAGQINAGDQTAKLTVVYSSVIDSMSKMEDDSSKGFQAYEKTASALKSSIPSSDNLISALMTANPLMGYGVKMVRDIMSSSAENRKRAKIEAARRLKLLRGQEAYLQEQFKTEEAQVEVVEAQADAVAEDGVDGKPGRKERSDKGVPRSSPYKEVLVEIQSDIKELLNIWKGDPIEGISESIDNLVQQTAENTQDQIDAATEMEDRRERAERLEDLKAVDTTESPVKLVDHVETKGVREKKEESGMLSSLLGGIGRLILGSVAGLFAAGGIGAALGLMIKPFTGLIKFVMGIGKFAVGLGARLLLPVAVIMSLYDFFDGFFNASKFLDKEDSKISITERISVGIANVVAAIVGIFDSVLEMFGVDLIDTEGLTKTIHDFFMGFPAMVTKMLDTALVYMEDMYGQVTTSLKGQVDDVKKGFVDAYTGIVDKVLGIFNSITDTFKVVIATIEKKFQEWKQSISNIPGIGPLFATEDNSKIELDPIAVEKAGSDLKEMTSSTNLLRLNDGVATMVPLETGSSTAATGVQRAEQKTQIPMKSPVMVNAPTSTVNNINQGGGVKTTNTSNTNHKFRRLADGYR